MISFRLIAIGAVVLTAVGIVFGAYSYGYDAGESEQKAKQAAADKKTYAKILDKIRSEDVNLDDPAAVDRFLSELAGEPEVSE